MLSGSPSRTGRSPLRAAAVAGLLAAVAAVGFDKHFGEKSLPVPAKLHVLSDTSAAALFGLGEEFLRPRPAGETGPLSAAIKEAASGRHALVVGTTPANLPDQLRADDVPGFLRSFQPLLKAESISATLD